MEKETQFIDSINNIFKLNIHSKNSAGWFHLSVYDGTNNTNPPAAPSGDVGYFPIPNNTPGVNKPPFNLVLPNDLVNELTPTFTVFKEMDPTIGKIAPTRGVWQIDFDISCIGKDLVERIVTPKYQITGRNYYDELITDPTGNAGFKIYLLKDFDIPDTITMLNENTKRYNNFKIQTGRQ